MSARAVLGHLENLAFYLFHFFSEFKEFSKNMSFLEEFIKLDKDGDGFITVEDMKQSTLKDLKDLDEKGIKQMFLLMDDDGDGKISFTGTFS